jgi:tRNA(adenine34) deaminase
MSFQDKDIYYMQQALHYAQKGYAAGEVPIGSVIVDPLGEIIGTGYNQTESLKCQDQHAELCAIRQASSQRNDWRLDGCTLYVTLEPCVMCVGCIVLSRVERLVYAAESPLYGFMTSQKNNPERISHENIYELYAKSIKNITFGVCGQEAQLLLKKFFQERRIKGIHLK